MDIDSCWTLDWHVKWTSWWLDMLSRGGTVHLKWYSTMSATLRLVSAVWKSVFHCADAVIGLLISMSVMSAMQFDNWEYLLLVNVFIEQVEQMYYAFSALTLLVGRLEDHPACKNWVLRCWCGYLSGVRCWIVCIWSSWCHCHSIALSSLASFKSRLVLPFWYWLTQVVLEKRLLKNWCSS